MNPDQERWRRSYEYLPFGAGEDEIANGSKSDLQRAHRLMVPCREKPPEYHFELSSEEALSLISEGRLLPYFEKLVLDEGLRYARVCRELAARTESDNPERALDLLRSSLLPESCDFAFEDYDDYKSWWDRTSQQAVSLGTELMELMREVQDISEEAGDNGDKAGLFVGILTRGLEWGVCHGLSQAGNAINEKQDAWNFWTKASMTALEERIGHPEQAGKLKEECLDILRITADDDLWSSLIDRATGRSVISSPAAVPAAPPMADDVETALNRLLDSKLEPLLGSIGENLQVSHALHDRLDLIVEKLIDLNQQSELTWQQIRKLARQEPDYEETRRGIETSLSSRLGDTWRQLKPDSRKDLVDAEYVFQQCTRWGTGWRMAVLGYCTTAERELRASYRAARDEVLAVPENEPRSVKTFGDLIHSLEELETWWPKSKPMPAFGALLNSADALRRLNKIRKRAAHSGDQEVSRDQAVWARKALLGNGSGSLLATIRAVQIKE